MRQGRIVQWDTAFNLYHEPAERFVAEFIGQGALIGGTVRDPYAVETPLGVLTSCRRLSCPVGGEVDVLLRPDEIRLDEQSPLRGRVLKYAFKGAETLYTIQYDGAELPPLLALAPSGVRHAAGDEVGVRVCTEQLVAFPKEPAAGQVRVWRPPESPERREETPPLPSSGSADQAASPRIARTG